MFIYLLSLLFFQIAQPASIVPEQGSLIIEVNNIEKLKGMVWVGIYRSEEDFLDKEKAIIFGYDVYQLETMTIEIPNLPYGQYAMALFHDENNNGEMDRNLVGIPSEPYSFSQPLKSKWRLPKFSEVTFDFKPTNTTLNTTLHKWWKS